MKVPHLGSFVPKNQNYQFMLEVCAQTNSKIQKSMVMLTPFCFRLKIRILGEFDPKIQNRLIPLIQNFLYSEFNGGDDFFGFD